MRLAAFILSCCLFLQSAPARAAEPDVPEGWTISKVVVLASSGVRAPTHFEEQLQSMEDTEILPVTDDTHPVQHVTDQNKKQ